MRASAFGWLRSVLPAWGEPARPGFPPEGETGKGASNSFLAAAGYFRLVPGCLDLFPVVTHSALPSAVQSCLDAVAPQHLKMIQCLFPPLHRVPFLNHVSQRQID
jgi:hypothetical protein